MAWSPEQISNAKVVIQVGRQLGASNRDITIALMAGFVESNLRNLNYGDRDSIGMFQQRNAWGSRADRLNPYKSARMFFLGGAAGQRGLLDFKQRNSWDLGQAAQKVQVSAFPDRYATWQDESEQLLKELGGSAGKPAAQPADSIVPELPGAEPEEPEKPLVPPAPMTALGLSSPTSTGLEAAGVAAQGAPGLESADEAPQFDQPDLMGLMEEAEQSAAGHSEGDGHDHGGGHSYANPNAKGNYNLPGVKSYVLSAANELGGMFGIKSIGGVGDRPNQSDHPSGKALDFMVRGTRGNQLAAFAQAQAKRLGVTYIIWNQRIWSVGRAKEGWRRMEDRGGDTANHVDHVHISFK